MEDETQPIPREALLSRPPIDVQEGAPPAAAAVPDEHRRRGLGWLWVTLVVVFVAAFVAATYLVVDRAERDRPTGRGGAVPDETTTTGPATTTTAPPPSTVAPADLAVVVLNGTTRIGWAGENVALLGEAGYGATASDAAEVDTTTVYVAEGHEADGAAVAAALARPDAPVEPRPGDSLATDGSADAEADVVVVLGADSLG